MSSRWRLISVADPNINVIDENSINRSSYLSVSNMAKIKAVDTRERNRISATTISSVVACSCRTSATGLDVQGEYFLSLYIRHATFSLVFFCTRCEITDRETVACR